MKNQSAAVLFDSRDLEQKGTELSVFDIIIAPRAFREQIEARGQRWHALEDYVEPGSIYEANMLVIELSELQLSDGSRLAKSFVYQGYELWWINYQNLYLKYCLPYTQYRKLLSFLSGYTDVYFSNPPFYQLFKCYLEAYGSKVTREKSRRLRLASVLPFGMLIQIFFTLLFLPLMLINRHKVLLFTGDKFDTGKDYDFRMQFIYEELRKRKIYFIEFIRSLEPWNIIFGHALTRKRPVLYSEAVTFIARFLNIMSFGPRRAQEKFGHKTFEFEIEPEQKFKYYIAAQYLLGAYEDVWAIRIMKIITRMIGIKVAIIPAATERNFHTVIACKLNNIPTIGILHGANSFSYNIYDFTPKYDGEKTLSVDKYGVWSEWWKEYYVKHSRAYSSDQLHISGPMRPALQSEDAVRQQRVQNSKLKVLFVSEVVAVPEEVIPYLETLINSDEFSLYIKFRSSNDIFESWLEVNRPDLLKKINPAHILKGKMYDAIAQCDVVVGSQSTGVIESTIQLLPFVFFQTSKWGDYFEVRTLGGEYNLLATNQTELVAYIKQSQSIPKDILADIRLKFFGDHYMNGSKWVVDEVEAELNA